MLLLAPLAGDDVTEGAGPRLPVMPPPMGAPEPPRGCMLVVPEGVALFWGVPLGKEEEVRWAADCWGVRVLVVLVLLVIDSFFTASVEQEEK